MLCLCSSFDKCGHNGGKSLNGFSQGSGGRKQARTLINMEHIGEKSVIEISQGLGVGSRPELR